MRGPEPDTTPPTTSVSTFAGAVANPEQNLTLVAEYRDNKGIDVSSISAENVVLTPNTTDATVELTEYKKRSDGVVIATYRIVPPAGGYMLAHDGTYTVSVGHGVTDDSGNVSIPVEQTMRIEAYYTPTMRINAGGEAFDSLPTVPFRADEYAKTGFTHVDRRIDFGRNNELYQTERASGRLRYEVPVVPNRYQVTLFFAELHWDEPGQRVFDIKVEGQMLAENYDIIQRAGGKGRSVEISGWFQIDDGQVDIDLIGKVDNAKLSGFKIRPADIPYDYVKDGVLNAEDISLLQRHVRSANGIGQDLNGDDRIDIADYDFLVDEVMRVKRGDVNTDGKVDFADFVQFNFHYGWGVDVDPNIQWTWKQGDFDNDGKIGFSDFLLLSQNYGK